jgi:hypothetical protein
LSLIAGPLTFDAQSVPVVGALFASTLSLAFQFFGKPRNFVGTPLATVTVVGDGLKFIASIAHYVASGPGTG